MSETSITYRTKVPNEQIRSLFERFFFDYQNVQITDDSRIVDIPEEELPEGWLSIQESAIFQGFDNGTWISTSDVRLQEEGVIIDGLEINVISGTPIEGEGIVNIFSDDGKYLASRYNDTILLFAKLDQLTVSGLKKILTSLGFESIDDVEYFTKKLERVIMRKNKRTILHVQKRLMEIDGQQMSAFSQYVELGSEKIQLQRDMEGMKTFDERLGEQCLNQVDRLLRSSYLDSVEFVGNRIVAVTKPIKLGIWDIGAFEIAFDPNSDKPDMRRVQYPAGRERIVSMDGSEFSNDSRQHPHITGGNPCTGNWEEQFKAFWDRDMLYGFNLAIRYLRSYNQRNPYIKLERFLMAMGYIHDAEILEQKKAEGLTIQLIDDGEIHVGRGERTHTLVPIETLYEWGCTGELEHDPNVIERAAVEALNARGNVSGILPSLEYVAWEESQQEHVVQEEGEEQEEET